MSNNTRRTNNFHDNDMIYENITILYRSCETIRRNINIIQRRFLNNTNINFSNPNGFTTRHLESVKDIIMIQSQMYQTNLIHINDLYNIIDRRYRPNNMNQQPNYSGNYANINGVYYNIDNIQLATNPTTNNSNGTNTITPEQNINQDTPSPISVTEPSLNENVQNEEYVSQPLRNTRQRSSSVNRRMPREQYSRFLRQRYTPNHMTTIQNRFMSTLPNVLRNPIENNMQPSTIDHSLVWGNIFNNNGSNTNIFNNGRSAWENIATDFLQNLTNVPVFPSQNDISNATREVVIENNHIASTPRCPISWEPFEVGNNALQIIPCGHMFHREPIRRWFQTSVRCPLCRYDIRDYTQTDTNNETNISQTNEQTNNQETTLPVNEISETITSEQVQEQIPNNDEDENPRNNTPLPTPQTIDDNQPAQLDINQDINNVLNLFTQLSLNEIQNQGNRQEQTNQSSSNQTGTTPDLSLFNLLDNELQSSIGNEILHNLFTNNISNLSIDPSTNNISFETIIGRTEQDLDEVD